MMMSLKSIIIILGSGSPKQIKRRGMRVVSFGYLILVLLLLLVACYVVGESHDDGCNKYKYPAMYNFGDSNSDTGASSAVFTRIPPPSGTTFFGNPSGRHSDGRLIIDFLAEKLGLPYLNAYLDSIGTSFNHGANFAQSGATIEVATGNVTDAGFNPLSLSIQLSQFQQFKNRSIELYVKKGSNGRSSDSLPKPKDFARALYIIDIGQNDLHYKLITFTQDQVLESIPDLINRTTLAIKILYEEGGRNFWIQNTGPIGCLPFFLDNFPPKPENRDEIGCIKSHNEVVQEFNKQLKDKVLNLRVQLQDAALSYVDVYSAKYTLFKDATNEGFVDPHGYCCKHPENPSLRCWDVNTVNGTSIYATSCSNPGTYISWDSIHYTEAANRWILNHLWYGSPLTPPLPKACPNIGSQD